MRQSPQAAVARADVAVARAEARGRALYSNPSVSYSREGAGYTEFFQAEQTLPLSGRIGILRRTAEAAAGAAEANADAVIWQLRSEVRSMFYRLLALQGREHVLKATTEDLREPIRVLATREKEGEGTRFDRLRWERELVEIGAEITSVRAQLAQAQARLLEFLPPGATLDRVEGVLVSPGELPALDDLLDRALTARSEIHADNQWVARLRLEQRAASRLRYPEPVISAGLKRAETVSLPPAGGTPLERTQHGVFFGITVPIPSFSRGQFDAARSRAEQTRVEAHRRALEHQIRAQVTGAYRALLLRREALRSYQQELGGRNDELLKIVQAAYQEGAAGILELLDVFRLQRQSQQRLIDLGLAVREAQVELEKVMGLEVVR